MVRQLIAGLTLASMVTACSSGAGTPAFGPGTIPNVSRPDANTAPGNVKVRISIPARTALRSHYVSPSTKSIVIKAYSSKHKLLASKTQNLSAKTKGCKRGTSALVCTFEFSVPAGKDRFYATTYDRAKGKGNALSLLSNFARTVKAGKTVKLPLVLDGIPHSILIEVADADNSAVFQTKTESGYLFAGLIGHTMQLAPLDADGNIITGPGAPTLGLVSSDTTNVSIAAVTGTTNDFLVTPKGDAGGITLTASAKPAGKGSTVHSSTSLSIGSVLYVANYGAGGTDAGSVTAYAPWSDAPIETITSGVNEPGVLTLDGSGNLWVGNDDSAVPSPSPSPGSIVEYAAGSTVPSRTIRVYDPNTAGGESISVDKSGNLYCACDAAGDVLEFAPGGSTPSRSLTTTSSPTGISDPYSVVADASGNIYVANYGSNTVGISKFGPTGTTPLSNITNGINGVWLIAMDKAGNLYGGNYSSSPNTIVEYAPGGSTPIKTFGSTSGISGIYALAVDTSGNVYSGNYLSTTASNVTQFTAASAATPVRTLPMPNAAPFAVATDPLGNVYVPVSNDSTVLVYPSGTSVTAARTLTAANGIDTPYWVSTWP